MEQQVKILQLQKELEKERQKLGELRRAEYKDVNTNVSSPSKIPSNSTI